MGESELSELVVLNHAGTHHIESREEPATTAGLLIGDSIGGNAISEVAVNRCFIGTLC